MLVKARLVRCLGLEPGAAEGEPSIDAAAGTYALSRAVNVDIGLSGAASRRPGFVRLAEGAFHSLWADGGEAYAVMGETLVAVGADGSVAPLRDGLALSEPMAFARMAGRVFFANGFEKGIVADGRCLDWGGAPYPGPDRFGTMGDPPAGTALAAYAGRVFIARENMVWFTGAAGLFHWVDRTAGRLAPFDADVRLLAAVRDGLYAGTGRGVWFLSGDEPSRFVSRRVCGASPVTGAFALLDGDAPESVAGMSLGGPAVLFAAGDGIYLGKSGGAVSRVKRIPKIAGKRGCAFAGESAFLALIEP